MYRKVFALAAITIVTFFLRFYRIAVNPPGLFQDEAAMGYSAFSVLHTGRDEYGQVLPIAFRSFADYKLPLYVYFTVVPVKILGLNILSTRITSVVLGTLSGLLLFMLVKELFGRDKWFLGLTVYAVYSVSPWSLMASRSGYESNLGLFLILAGILLQVIAARRKRFSLLLLAAVFYALSCWAYITYKLIAVILFPIISLILRNQTKKAILAFGCLLFLAGPQFGLLFFAAGNNRIASLTSISGNTQVYRMTARYAAYFSPRSLFFDPDPDPGKSYPEVSTFFPWMFFPYIVGLFSFAAWERSRSKFILATILAVAPIPAAVAQDPFATIRSLPLVIPMAIIIGLGLTKIFTKLSPKWLGPLLVIVSLIQIYSSVFVLLPHERGDQWGYGYEQLNRLVDAYPNLPVLFDDPRGVYYIEFLFFQKILLHPTPLANYYNNSKFVPEHVLGRISTRNINWGVDPKVDQLIIAFPTGVNDAQAEQHGLEKILAITYPNQLPAFNVYRTHPDQAR